MLRYFISDLHLSDKRLDLIQAFVHLVDEIVQQIPPCELYILGDFFEAYIGDDYQPEWMSILDQQFSKLNKSGVTSFFIPGNRDFLVGEDWLARHQIVLLPEQFILRVNQGLRLMLSHGDEFCVDDLAYQAFRSMTRQPTWQQEVLSMPLNQRIALAQKLRDDSKGMSAEKSDAIMDVNPSAIEASLPHPVNLLIHGHTHRPALYKNTPVKRLVLGDWDQHVWLAKMTDQGITQYRAELAQYLANNSQTNNRQINSSDRETWQVMHSLLWEEENRG